MIWVTDTIAIDEDKLRFTFKRAPGPGGQNVNKVESGVELRFDALRCPSLADDVRQRLFRLAGHRATREGVVVINAHRFRTQQRNRTDAIARLVDLLRRAASRPELRRPTKPTRAAVKRRLAAKRHRSQIKQTRRTERSE